MVNEKPYVLNMTDTSTRVKLVKLEPEPSTHRRVKASDENPNLIIGASELKGENTYLEWEFGVAISCLPMIEGLNNSDNNFLPFFNEVGFE